jgi:hypothetical protein
LINPIKIKHIINPDGRKMMGRILCRYRLIDIDLFHPHPIPLPPKAGEGVFRTK